MKKLRDISVVLALLAAAFAGIGVGVAGLRVGSAANTARTVALAESGRLDGVLARTGKLLDDSRGTVAELNRAALAERHYFQAELPELNAQVSQTLRDGDGEMLALASATNKLGADADALTVSTQTSLATLDAQLNGLSPLQDAAVHDLDDLGVTVRNANAAVSSLNTVISNPAIPSTLDNVNATASHLDDMAGYTAQWLYSAYHPSKTKQFFNALEGIGVTCLKVACW